MSSKHFRHYDRNFLCSVTVSLSIFSLLPNKIRFPLSPEFLIFSTRFPDSPRRRHRPPGINGLGRRGQHWHYEAAAAAMLRLRRRGEGGSRRRGEGYGGAGRKVMDREEEDYDARDLPRRVAHPGDHG
jgi:hypothetical protein